MMIARKSILNKSKLSSGASLLSTTPWRYTESSKMTAKTSCGPWSRTLNGYTTTWRTFNKCVTKGHMQVYGAPVRLPVKKWPWLATSPVALQNTPKKTTRSTSTKHSRIICREIFGLNNRCRACTDVIYRILHPPLTFSCQSKLLIRAEVFFYLHNMKHLIGYTKETSANQIPL